MSPRWKFYFLWSVFLIPLLSFALSGFIWASDYSNEVVDTISSEHSPQEIAITPNGQYAYGGRVSAYNMIQITNNSTDDFRPSLHNGKIAWFRDDGTDYEIFYWDGSTIYQITNNSTSDEYPSLHNGKIAWRGEKSGEYSSEIYYWDGSTIRQITYHLSTFGAYDPSLHDGKIAWAGRKWDDASVEISYWDGSTIHEVTDNSSSDEHPDLHNGKLAWAGWDGADWEIYYWDGSTVHQITDNSTNDMFPSLHNAMIAWQGWDGADWEIYYMPGPEGLIGTISGKVTDSSTGEGISGATVSADGYSDSTNPQGNYSLSLPEATYTVTASADGYISQTKTHIMVTAGTTTTVDFFLEPVPSIIIYPNPCYPDQGQIVTIANLPLTSEVKIYIYDLGGNLVRTLGESEANIEGGSKTATWDCRNEAGQIVPRGIYIYLITSNAEKKAGKIAIIK